jgi:translocation and assembly module TamB
LDRLNRILILFFTLLAFSLGGVIHLIQTEKFASIASEKIKKRAQQELGLKLSFQRIEVKLFPPATLLKNVKIEYPSESISLSVNGEELGLFFSFFDFFSRKFQVDTVKLHSSEVVIKTGREKAKPFDYKESFSNYQKIRKDLKFIVKNVELANVDLIVDDYELDVGKVKTSFHKSLLVFQGNLRRLSSEGITKKLNTFDLDSLEFLIHSSKTMLNIKKVNIRSKLDQISATGRINYSGNEEELNLIVKLKAGIRSLATKLGYQKEIDEYPVDGFTNFDLGITGTFSKPEFKLKSSIEDIVSDYATADLVNLELRKSGDQVWLDNLKVFKSDSVVTLKNKLPFYNIEKKQIVSNEAFFIAKDVHTNDALYILREYLDILKAKLSGELKIGWNKKGIYFVPSKGFEVKDLKLFKPDYNGLILENNGFTFNKAFMLLTYDMIFKFSSHLKMGDTNIFGEGSFGPNRMEIKVFDSFIDFEEIGPIVGLSIKSNGTLKGTVRGSYDDIKFSFSPNLNDLKILDFNLGNIKGEVDFYLKNLFLKISEAYGTYESSEYNGGAGFKFEEDEYSLDITVPRATFLDARSMVPTLVRMIYKEDVDLDFNLSGDLKYQSDFNSNNISMSSNFKGENVNFLGERIDSFAGSISLKDFDLKIPNLRIKKGQGDLSLSGNINIKKDEFKYKGNLTNLGLKDFDAYNALNMGLNGKLRGDFYGEGKFTSFTSRNQFRLEKSEIGSRAVPDSIFTVYNKGSEVFLSANVFEGISISEGYISTDKKARKKSYINTRLYTTTPSLLAGVLSEHNYISQSLKGNLDLRAELGFYLHEFENFDFDLSLSKLELDFLNEKVVVNENKNKLRVRQGQIQEWNLYVDIGSDGHLESLGKGNIANSFQVNSKLKLNPIFAKLLTPKVLSATGSIEAGSILLREKEEFSFHSETIGSDIDLKIDKVPGALRGIDFKIVSEGQDVLLEKLKGTYGKGTISADGNVKLKLPFPEVNLNGAINSSQVAITDKTYLVVSGNATLKGNSLPYILDGGVSVLHGEVLNEFEDFSKLIGLSEGYLRYIPNSGRLSKLDLLNYDLDFDIFNPIQVRNSISDLKLDGSLKIRGGLLKPLVSGDLNILPNISKIFFKGNEFVLSEGRMSFLDVNKKEVPEIKLVGLAQIDRYEVGLAVDGRVDKFGLKLTSNPTLDQGQILSLLVLGVPEDINKELNDSEREQIAVQGGVGLIVERFKLVKPIDSMLGLKFSVSPEFQEDNSSLLEGRLNSGEAGASRYKSGTKIKVQKKILKKVDVSFSSTVGGTVEETKEMNVNYNINKNLSLEGVYELRSAEEETEENPDSIGADFKWKFSF